MDASFAGLGCLLFNNTSKLSWEDASNYCQDDEDAKLLEISNSLQMDFVRSELALIYDYDSSTKYWWTSATDQGREEEWYWASSGAPVPELVWGSSPPSGITRFNCMVLARHQDFYADDQVCTRDDLASAICQKHFVSVI